VKAWLKDFWLMNVNDDKVGRQGHVVLDADGVLVVKKYLWGMNDAHGAVAFYNPTETSRRVTVSAHELEFAGPVKWTDRFDAGHSGSFEDNLSVEIPAHGTLLYYVSGTPVLRENYRVECARRMTDRPALVWECVFVPKTDDYRLEVVSASKRPVDLVVNGRSVGALAGGSAATVRLDAPENRVILAGEGLADIRGIRVTGGR